MGVHTDDLLIEGLASEIHDLWVSWSKSLADDEVLSPKRLRRWSKLWVGYSYLPESEKEKDRKIARSLWEKVRM